MVTPVHHVLWMFFIVVGGFLAAVVASFFAQLTRGRFDRRTVQRPVGAGDGGKPWGRTSREPLRVRATRTEKARTRYDPRAGLENVAPGRDSGVNYAASGYAQRVAAGWSTIRRVPSTVHVLATTVEGTRAAIAAAIPVARKRRAPVVLLVEHDDWQTARCLRAAHEIDPTITAKCLVGSNTTDAVKEHVPVLALIVIGGPTRWWWPTRHERLAARLQRHGRDVMFVGCARDLEPPTDCPAAAPRRDGSHVRTLAR